LHAKNSSAALTLAAISDADQLEHTVEVSADSLYEAIGRALPERASERFLRAVLRLLGQAVCRAAHPLRVNEVSREIHVGDIKFFRFTNCPK
jgi:hypothetical protein